MIKVNNGVLFNTEFGTLKYTDEPRDRSQLPERIIKVNVETFKEAITVHNNYWEWKKNRNAARSELEELYQFDTKHASHLIRLLKMCVETLQTGELNVFRADAEELKQIRSGKYNYNEILEYATDLNEQAQQLYKTTSLRSKVDLEESAKILFKVQDAVWSR